jgi:hypothetical protein
LSLKEKREEDGSKQHENFKITPPISSPEEKTIIVVPTVTTDNVINSDVLETEELRYIL